MSKKFCVFLTALFCAFVGGMLLASALLPDKALSEMENRALQQAPALSLRGLTDGSFMSSAEKYAADQIAGRELWVALKAWCERLSGKRENNGVYFGRRDTLLKRMDEPDWEKIQRDMGDLNQLVQHVSVPVFFGLIPSSSAVWAERLPAGAPTANERSIIDSLYSQSEAETVDLYSALLEHREEDIYYRTDHHWTSWGAYRGYEALTGAMGLAPATWGDELSAAQVSQDFLGTLSSTSGVTWVPPDEMGIYVHDVPRIGLDVTFYHTGRPEPGSLYVESYLREKDKYSFFLGGMQPLCVIRSQKAGAPRVLVVRDSYSDCLAPMLALSCSELHLWDFRGNLESLQGYIQEHNIDQVLVLYSLSNFLSDQNLFLLAR